MAKKCCCTENNNCNCTSEITDLQNQINNLPPDTNLSCTEVQDCVQTNLDNLQNQINNLSTPTLNVTRETIYAEYYSGESSTGTNVLGTRNSTMTRTNVGRWQVRFNTPHPEGSFYTPEFSWQESGTLRDNPKIGIVQGTKNANGFDVMITYDDNGGTADIYTDHPWTYGVESPLEVITDIESTDININFI